MMRNKKILIILLALIIILLICEFYLYLEMTYKKNMVIETNLEKFEPFSKNNILKKYEVDIKLQKELPRIKAASAFYPFAANFVQNLYNEDSYSKEVLQLVSTSQTFKDIISGKADIIIATEPSEEQKEMIKKSNVDLKYKTIYLEPLAILINKSNSIDNLYIDQIQEFYFDSNSSWNTYQLEKNNGSQTCFESIVKNNSLSKNHYEIKTMPKIIDKIAEDKKGIGYSFYSYYSKMYKNNDAKIISVNNKNIDEKDYPLLFEVYLIYREDNTNENISKIVDWLETEEGKEFIYNIK